MAASYPAPLVSTLYVSKWSNFYILKVKKKQKLNTTLSLSLALKLLLHPLKLNAWGNLLDAFPKVEYSGYSIQLVCLVVRNLVDCRNNSNSVNEKYQYFLIVLCTCLHTCLLCVCLCMCSSYTFLKAESTFFCRNMFYLLTS